MDNNEIIDRLKKNRPQLSVASLYSYSSTLRALYKRVFDSSDIDIDKFNDTEKIMKDLESKPATTRKTVLAILYVLTENDDYKTQMDDDIKSYKADTEKQEMNQKQKENYLTQENILTKFKELEKEAKQLYKKESLSAKEKQKIQDYIILALTSGIFIPPRRSLDWCAFKIKNIEENDNHLDKNKFVFKTYKGSAKKGEQVIPVPKPLLTILNKWISINDSEYLLHDINGNALNSVKLNQRLNKIFDGKHSAVNTLRHSYLSEKFQDTIEVQKKMESTMKNMGSSIDQSKIYINKL
jgi:integrase